MLSKSEYKSEYGKISRISKINGLESEVISILLIISSFIPHLVILASYHVLTPQKTSQFSDKKTTQY